ncbi:MAG: S8 family peptidase [Pirellulales bacterium]
MAGSRIRRHGTGRAWPNRAAYGRFERLEERRLLTATALGTIDLGGRLVLDSTAPDIQSILVRFRDEPACLATECQPPDAAPLPAGGLERTLPVVPGLHKFGLPPGTSLEETLAAYRANPAVLYAEPDYRVQLAGFPNDPQFGALWGLHNQGQTGGTDDADIDAPLAWDVTTGTVDTIVAVIDTGVDYLHEDLAANMWVNPGEIAGDGIDNDGNGYVDDVYGYDFVNRDGDPLDDHNHGTHVAGTIAAVGDNGIGVTGVSWNSRVMALKFLDATGSGTLSGAIEAIEYAVAMGATISNNSWGANEEFSQALYDAIAAAGAAGHLFVTAAGNGFFGIPLNNDSTPFYPANYNLDNIVVAAATDHHDALGSFSNYGATTVDLGAPGVNILSTTRNNTYSTFSGTSMATPHVSGAAALLRGQHPEWSYSQVIAQLFATVDPVAALAGKSVTGGRLNVASALGNPEPPPPSGTLPIAEDFEDGIADFFGSQTGSWVVSGGRYHTTPLNGQDAITTLRIEGDLPSNLEIEATIQADEATGSYSSNAFVIFDYQSPTDFKFAGAYAGVDRWLVGRRTSDGWLEDATLSQVIDAGRDYDLRVTIEEPARVTLFVDGVRKLSHDFAGDLSDGRLGLATRNAVSHFDDVQIDVFDPPPPPPPPSSSPLPIDEDFDDHVADHFQPETGTWQLFDGRYHASPIDSGNAVSLLLVEGGLPSNVELSATINSSAATGSYLSNALLIFDYQGPTDFKFAGAYDGANRWLIGRRTASGWFEDAGLGQTIDSGRDYQVHLAIDEGSLVSLSVDGTFKVSFAYSESVVDGGLGLGTRNAISRFDNVQAAERVPPPPPPQGTLPIEEDFDDGLADYFLVRQGTWQVASGRYDASPVGGGDAISTVSIAGSLPLPLEVEARINVQAATGSLLSNALVIFDYQGSTDFKFAGAYAGAGRWLIGRRTASGWLEDAKLSETIQADRDYDLKVLLDETGRATLFVDGAAKLGHTFTDSLSDGAVGLATRNALAKFDNVSVREHVPPPPPPSGTLPIQEDFNDDLADFFLVRSGTWQASSGRYHASPISGGDAVSTLRIADALPADLEMRATIHANAPTGSLLSNALLVFDYQGPTDFKFAGAYEGANRWLIGRRTASGWLEDAKLNEAIDPVRDYRLTLRIENGTRVTLIVDGATKLSFTYGDTLIDGSLGLATRNAVSHFDDVAVEQTETAGTAQAVMLFSQPDGGEDETSQSDRPGGSQWESPYDRPGSRAPAVAPRLDTIAQPQPQTLDGLSKLLATRAAFDDEALLDYWPLAAWLAGGLAGGSSSR